MKIGNVNASLLNGNEVARQAEAASENSKFSDLVKSMQEKEAFTGDGIISSSHIVKEGRLNGDISTGFDGAFTSASDKSALPAGAAANQASVHARMQTIDRTTKLYEKSLELESYIVKMMISSMRKTVSKSDIFGGDSFASQMYEDMLYDEYATSLTKNAGFGLADQVYLQLNVEA